MSDADYKESIYSLLNSRMKMMCGILIQWQLRYVVDQLQMRQTGPYVRTVGNLNKKYTS